MRVAYKGAPAGGRERTYRIFVEELPVRKPDQTRLTLALKLGMPVFIQPAQGRDEWQIEALGLEKGRARVAIRNDGNRHLIVRDIAAQGIDAGGNEVFAEEIGGWYVLSGAARPFFAPIAREACVKLEALRVSVRALGQDNKEAETKVAPTPDSCSPAAE